MSAAAASDGLLVIRLATPDDGARLAEIYRPAIEVHPTSFELTAPDGPEMARRVQQITTRFPWLVATEHDVVLGYAYASAHRERYAYQWSVEVSAYVDAGAHRRGLARRLYTSLFAILTRQGFQNAYAGVALPNMASERLHERLGFTPIGTYQRVGFKHGTWRNVRWYARALGDHPAAPAQPRWLPDIVAEPGFTAALTEGLAAPV